MLYAGFAQADITPVAATDLAGYFNRRRSTGVLDPLMARAAVLEDGSTRLALVAVDLIGFPVEHVRALRERLGHQFPHLAVTATHTHTGPVLYGLFAGEADAGYIGSVLYPGIERAIREATGALARCRVLCGEAREKGLAFNRRYWMRDGRVVTNPPKGHPDILRPEGPADHEVTAYLFEAEGVPRGILVDACNHTDTIGGCAISADWPGQMAHFACDEFEREVPVLLLNGPAGNVNHFDPDGREGQTSYDEAKRIGLGYAGVVRKALARAQEIDASPLAVRTVAFRVPYRDATEEDVAWARRTLAAPVSERQGDLTAEDMAKGDPQVERLYAEEMLRFAELRKKADGEDVEITAFRMGEAAFVGLPGEPFVEIGLTVKRRSPFPLTSVFALCNGEAGYVPLEEHFAHGGYEPRTTLCNRLAHAAGSTFIRQALAALEAIRG